MLNPLPATPGDPNGQRTRVAATMPVPEALTHAGDPAAATPEKLSRFTIVRPHAQGGLGEVLVAQDEELHREVAFKRIKPGLSADAEARRRFLVEAEITAKLEHPGIVPVYGLVQGADGQPSYAMRFIQGESLAAAIRRWQKRTNESADRAEVRVAFRALLQRFISVCQTMAYVHSRGVIHRDLKPANIMLGPFGETLVVDWGLAKQGVNSQEPVVGEVPSRRATAASAASASSLTADHLPETQPAPGDATRLGQALGTPAYMSPEQAAGQWDLVGPASDIYGLGGILYTLLTDAAPSQGSTLPEILENVQAGAVKSPRELKSDIPRPLEAICLKALARRPEDRYASAAALADDVEHWLADEPVSAYTEPWPVQCGRWLRRHRTWVGIGAAAASLLVVFLATVTLLIQGQNAALDAKNQELQASIVLEHNAREEAVAASRKAQEQEARATRNFGKAKQAVLHFLTALTEADVFRQNPNLNPLRVKLLERGAELYQQLVQEGNDADWELGHTYRLLGDAQKNQGTLREALAAYERGRAVFVRLVAAAPKDAEFRNQLGVACHNCADAADRLGQRSDVERLLREAIAHQEAAAQLATTPGAYRYSLGGHHNRLGLHLRSLARDAEAEPHFREAIRLHQQLADEFPKVPGYRNEVAGHYVNLGSLLAAQNRPADAEAAYRRAVELQEALVREAPADPKYWNGLAACYVNLGSLLQATQRWDEAEAAGRRALSLFEQLTRNYPQVPEFRQRLAITHSTLGLLHIQRGKSADGEPELRKAVGVYEKLAADFPDTASYRQELASGHHRLGGVLDGLGQPVDAEQEYRKAATLLEKLTAEFPGNADIAVILGGVNCDLGSLLKNHGQTADALERFGKSITILQAVLANNAGQPGARNFLRNAFHGRAELLAKAGRFAEAAKDWARTADLDLEQNRNWYRRQHALCLARAGDHAASAAEAEALAKPGRRYETIKNRSNFVSVSRIPYQASFRFRIFVPVSFTGFGAKMSNLM